MTPRSRRTPGIVELTLLLPDWLAKAIEENAHHLDMSKTGYVTGIIADALRTGTADRHALAAMDRGDIRIKRPPRSGPEFEWELVTAGEEWRNGAWALVRQGNGRAHRTAREDDGWYLIGPSLDEPLYLGTRVVEAKVSAVPYVRGS